jgi:acyl carrier protein
MAVIDQLKELMADIGVEDDIVKGVNPEQPLAGLVMDSFSYTSFIVAVEERFGIRILDRYALKIKTLNDFAEFIKQSA